MKPSLIALSLLFLLGLVSCNRENITPTNKSLLKSKYWYNTIDDPIPILRYYYLYDNSSNLETVNIYKNNSDTLYRQELFYYNKEGYPEYRLHFSFKNSSDGELIDSSYYNYENDLLKSEELYYLNNLPYQIITYIYEYLDSKLYTKCRFDFDELLSCTKYDFEEDLCIQETKYSDIDLTFFCSKIVHYYEDGVRVRSEASGSQGIVFQIIIYTYDSLGNLILEVSQETDFPVSAPIEYVYRYDYY